MKKFFMVLTIVYVFLGFFFINTAGPHQTSADSENHAMFVKPKDLKWKKIMPEMGNNSPDMVILHVDPKTQATQLMIRVPKNFHVPKHWHTANETHTILWGTFTMEAEGKRAVLGKDSFNYMPSKMIHEAWTKSDEGALLFITVDEAWDINWVDGPPQARGKK
jgi:mannose-6-phosphate isomerase-like protein (cupin superfamily)